MPPTGSTSPDLTFDGTNPPINLTGVGEARVSMAMLLNATTTFNGSGIGSADFNGVISGSGGLNINTNPQSDNLGWVQLRGANTFSGGVTLNTGSLYLGNSAAAGTGTLTINGGDLRSSTVSLSNAIVGNGGLDNRGSGSTTYTTLTSNATGSLSGTGGISLSGNGAVQIQNAATISGDVSSSFLNIGDQFIGILNPPFTQGPQLIFSGASGSGPNLTSFNMANAGRLYLDNQGAVNSDRINDSASVNLKDGGFWFRGNTAVTATETVGDLTVEGQSVVTLFSSSSTSSGAAQLTANSLSRVNGGTVIFRGTKLGSAADNTLGSTNLLFTNAPTAA